jgi:hypothetical protein
MMKSAFLLCAVIGATLVLNSCANQNSSATKSTRPRLNSESGAAGTGGGGGGGPNTPIHAAH